MYVGCYDIQDQFFFFFLKETERDHRKDDSSRWDRRVGLLFHPTATHTS